MDAAAVPADTKDWTWVLDRRCDECGFDPAVVEPDSLAGRIAATLAGWPERLARPDARERPATTIWSPTEYGAHVRDVAEVMGGRLALLLAEDDPLFSNWDQDATAVESDYAGADPADVAAMLAPAVTGFAEAYGAVPPDAWHRPGRRSNGSVFTVYTLGVYALHDLEHHRHDVGLAP